MSNVERRIDRFREGTDFMSELSELLGRYNVVINGYGGGDMEISGDGWWVDTGELLDSELDDVEIHISNN